MEDKEIVKLFWDRDEKAIEETQNKYRNYCYAIANNILHNNEDCEECLNDTYKAAWDSIPPHHPTMLSTYLGKISRRLAIDIYRNKMADKRGGGQYALSFDELGECIADNSFKEALEAKYLKDLINDFLGDIKEDERKVFVCRYFYFDSIDEIASRFHFSTSKVKMMLMRTREKLRDYLIKEGVME